MLVADWGGGWTGLDAAETLAEAGLRVWLAVAAPLVGETVHQYQRVFYLARLERLGVTILHHRELADAPGGAVLRSLWTHTSEPLPDGGAHARARARPRARRRSRRARSLRAASRARPSGDCRGARSLEEAILEGTVAGERPAVTVVASM